MGKYDDIMDLPHHVSKKHPQMPLSDRAAQFSPFAALRGHRAMIEETERLTEDRTELGEDKREEIALRLQILRERAGEKPEVMITFFIPDGRKAGGSYQTVLGTVKKVDEYKRQAVMEDGTVIPVKNISGIEGRIFEKGWND